MSDTILIVDDHREIRTLMRRILEVNGFAVEEADCGQAALEHLNVSLPSLVLLDVMMPGMTGLDVLEQIRSNPATARLPVILVTAKGTDEDVFTGYKYAADFYLTKPCGSKQLLYGVGLVLGRQDLIGR